MLYESFCFFRDCRFFYFYFSRLTHASHFSLNVFFISLGNSDTGGENNVKILELNRTELGNPMGRMIIFSFSFSISQSYWLSNRLTCTQKAQRNIDDGVGVIFSPLKVSLWFEREMAYTYRCWDQCRRETADFRLWAGRSAWNCDRRQWPWFWRRASWAANSRRRGPSRRARPSAGCDRSRPKLL